MHVFSSMTHRHQLFLSSTARVIALQWASSYYFIERTSNTRWWFRNHPRHAPLVMGRKERWNVNIQHPFICVKWRATISRMSCRRLFSLPSSPFPFPSPSFSPALVTIDSNERPSSLAHSSVNWVREEKKRAREEEEKRGECTVQSLLLSHSVVEQAKKRLGRGGKRRKRRKQKTKTKTTHTDRKKKERPDNV